MKIGSRRASGVLVAILVAISACMRHVPERSENVLLIVVDTLRADHLGSYGYHRPTSPRLDELATRGARFVNARAASSWTLPSVASMMTGLYPAVHGAERVDAALSDRVKTMAEAFRDDGWATAGFSANPTLVTPAQGFARGFERFEVLVGAPRGDGEKVQPERPGTDSASAAKPSTESIPIESLGPSPLGDVVPLSDLVLATAERVTSSALEWLSTRPPDRPFFLYLHYFDPHAAYDPPAEMARRFGVADGEPLAGPAQWAVLFAPTAPSGPVLSTLISLYDAEIASTDAAIGRLLDHLPTEIVESTLIVVTSDHGEEFGEHGGVQHGRTLFDELLRVPLLIAGRGVPAARRIEAPVSLVGLWPTIAALTGAGAPPPAVAPASFAPLLRNDPAGDALLFADLDARFPGDAQRHRRALMEGPWKLVMDVERGTTLFDLTRDPGEHSDVQKEGELRAAMRMRILDRDAVALATRSAAPPGQIVLDPIRRAQLKALGYLQ